MNQLQDVFAALLARQYARTDLFRDLRHQKQEGREVRAHCPLCARGGPHFSYSLDTPQWVCHKSGESGDWIKYMELKSGISFEEALGHLAGRARVDLPEMDREGYESYVRRADLLERAYEVLKASLASPNGEQALRFLGEVSGWSEEDVRAMGVGVYPDRGSLRRQLQQYSDEELDATGLFSAEPWSRAPIWLVVPWRDRGGRLTGLSASPLLPPDERERLQLRACHCIGAEHGFDRAGGFPGLSYVRATRGRGAVLLVQDMLTALYLNAQQMEPSVISVGDSLLSSTQACALEGAGIKTVCLVFKRDRSSQKAMLAAVHTLRRQTALRPLICSWPDSQEDLGSLFKAEGAEGLSSMVAQAEAWPKWLARHLVSTLDISTDVGIDLVLARSAQIYDTLKDPLEQRQFRESLSEGVGLSDSELEPRLSRLSPTVDVGRTREILLTLASQVESLARGGDLRGAEAAVDIGLKRLRRSGVTSSPEPYLVDDLRRDIMLSRAEGLKTGYDALDQLVTIPQRAVTVIAGPPGHGKTTLLLNLFARMIEKHPDSSFLFFSSGESKRALAVRLIMMQAGAVLDPSDNFRSYMEYLKGPKHPYPAIDRAISRYETWASSGRLLLWDRQLSTEGLIATIDHVAREATLGAVFLDDAASLPSASGPAGEGLCRLDERFTSLVELAASRDLSLILGMPFQRRRCEDSDLELEGLVRDTEARGANLVLGVLAKRPRKLDSAGPGTDGKAELAVHVLKNRLGLSGESVDLVWDKPTFRVLDKRADAATTPSASAQETWWSLLETSRATSWLG